MPLKPGNLIEEVFSLHIEYKFLSLSCAFISFIFSSTVFTKLSTATLEASKATSSSVILLTFASVSNSFEAATIESKSFFQEEIELCMAMEIEASISVLQSSTSVAWSLSLSTLDSMLFLSTCALMTAFSLASVSICSLFKLPGNCSTPVEFLNIPTFVFTFLR